MVLVCVLCGLCFVLKCLLFCWVSLCVLVVLLSRVCWAFFAFGCMVCLCALLFHYVSYCLCFCVLFVLLFVFVLCVFFGLLFVWFVRLVCSLFWYVSVCVFLSCVFVAFLFALGVVFVRLLFGVCSFSCEFPHCSFIIRVFFVFCVLFAPV